MEYAKRAAEILDHIRKVESQIGRLRSFPYDKLTAKVVISAGDKELAIPDLPITTKQLVEWTISHLELKIESLKVEMSKL